MKTDYDVLIIGSGASGGMAAYTLTQLGARCLMLDAGPPLDFERGRTLRPVWDLPYRGFGRPGRFPHITQASEFDAALWADEKQNPYSYPAADPYYWVRIKMIGGRTLRWGRASWRLSDYEFKGKDHDGFGENWPVSYTDLAPYYDRVEPIFKVAGRNEGFEANTHRIVLTQVRREIAKAFDDIVGFAGLEKFIDSPVKVYSTGMYVRLGFSVAVHVKPEVLIIDEVIAVGDAEFQRRCFDYLYTLKRQGVTIVLVSHSLALMQDMCDRLAWLDHGHLAAEGLPMEITREYVQRVDDQEAERLHQGDVQAGEGTDQGSRHGTQEITVESFQILNAQGEEIPMAVTGEPTTLRINYNAKTPIENPSFGLVIDHENGSALVALHSADAIHTGLVYGKGYIDYRIPRFTLMPGKMIVTIGVADEHNLVAYDYLHQWYQFHVRGGRDVIVRGMLELPGHWEPPVSDARRSLTG